MQLEKNTIDLIRKLSKKHPKPQNVIYLYGTAGFRMNHKLLDSVMFRSGLFSSLRSKKLQGKTIGIMITASHNPAEDNGIKLIDPYGEMLEITWEEHFNSISNAENTDILISLIEEMISSQKIDLKIKSNVIYAGDTRQSRLDLIKSLVDGLSCFETSWTNYKLLTTPQLHYIVHSINTKNTPETYGEPTELGYYNKLSKAYQYLMKDQISQTPLFVDCANGIGALKLENLCHLINKNILNVKIINKNTNIPSDLNRECGADFVKVQRKLPLGIKTNTRGRCLSFDGDADRIIYYYIDSDNNFKLLDGDKIASLIAIFMLEFIKKASIDVNIGIIQTAYSNRSSTNFISKILKIPVNCVLAGVKHLHHAAMQYDCGIYFEANGHGTIIFSKKMKFLLSSYQEKSPSQLAAANYLKELINLVNQTIGDSLSNMLLIEVILAYKNWNIEDWDNIYTDFPNRMINVITKNKELYETIGSNYRLVKPKELQQKIDALVSNYKEGKAFIRASGTENIDKVYAEALTEKDADELAFKVAQLIY
ncbi:hypothetical protein T552_03067 [Pneumocystis carinii B80]|uniref:Phosphoacetylglucosamine mutase n=1 Tax=Pneumocystis carinii (strain B80) TaxID=1408658 RepID=A0A0W4ZCN0_PNEC8|nr:hypothetical protein T552_03067 [Pneumocystis carinii B80]KTW26176.1 hypothetical protein T552_03067 [Pneumocystis carinii B80]